MSNSNEAKDASNKQNINIEKPEERQSRGDDKKKLQDEIAHKLKEKKLARKHGSGGTRSNISIVSTKTRLKTLQFFQKQEEKQKQRTEELLSQLGLVETTDEPVGDNTPEAVSTPPAAPSSLSIAAPEPAAEVDHEEIQALEDPQETEADPIDSSHSEDTKILGMEDMQALSQAGDGDANEEHNDAEGDPPAADYKHNDLSIGLGPSGSDEFEIENGGGSRSSSKPESPEEMPDIERASENELPAVESEHSLEFSNSSSSNASLDLSFSNAGAPAELPLEDQTRKANVSDLASSLGIEPSDPGLKISNPMTSAKEESLSFESSAPQDLPSTPFQSSVGLSMSEKHADCYFCQMEKTTLSQFIIEQTEFFSVFHHNAPMQAGHLLITPRGHYKRIEDLPSEVFAALMAKTKEWHEHLKMKFLGLPGVAIFLSDTLTSNLGDAKHVAINLIPRFPGDQFGIVLGNPQTPKPSQAQILKACERLKV